MKGKLKKDESFEPVLLKTWTDVALSDRKTFNFKDVDHSDGLLHRYLGGIVIQLSGTMKQTAATAALPLEDIHGLISQYSVKCNGHEFIKSEPGNILVLVDECDGIFKSGNAQGIHAADFANDVNDHALDLMLVHPFCYGWLKDNEERPSEGVMHLALFGEKGEIDIRTMASGDITADWGIKAGTTLTLKLWGIMFKSPHLYVPRPHVIESWSDGGVNPASSPVLAGKTDLLVTCHNTYDALTRPTASYSIKSDSETICDGLTGAERVYALQAGREDEFGREANTYQPHIVRNVGDTRVYKYGSKLELKGVNTSGAAMRHLIRRICDCDGELLTKWATALGLDITEDSASRFLIDGEPVGLGANGRMTADEKACLQREFM